MNDNQNWNAMGEQIKGALTEALQSGDFKNLNDLVAQTVTDTLNEVGKHIVSGNAATQGNTASRGGTAATGNTASMGGTAATGNTAPGDGAAPRSNTTVQGGMADRGNTTAGGGNGQYKETGGQTEIPMWQESERQKHEALKRNRKEQMQRRQNQMQQAANRALSPLSFIKFKRVGSVSSILYQVFGGVGLGITGMVTLMRLLALAFGGTNLTLAGWVVNLSFLAAFFGMIRIGVGQGRLLKRAERYVQLCDYKMYGDINKLARDTGKSDSYVRKDIQKMLDKGMFPEGHLDWQKTCFMLNDVVYRQYLEMEKNRRMQESEGSKALEQKENVSTPDDRSSQKLRGDQEAELNAMVAEGMECIRRLRDLNDKIEGEVISAKLYQLENLLKEIFDSVREHPEQMHRMHKLMDYYLPTTLKLVEDYEEFDRVSIPGREILGAKTEIENTLDTINQAFRELLNNLFQDAVFDATTDAQVLKTMLAREGLTKELEPVIRR